ncbi:MAG: glycosyltransferase [Armatimonadota bacterium]
MKYCIVGPAYPLRGGIAHHTSLLTYHLSREHHVHAVTFKRLYPSILFPGRSQIDPSAQPCDFDQTRIIDSLNPLTWMEAARTIVRLSPERVIIQWWQPLLGLCLGFIAGTVKKNSRVTFICHNVLPHESMPMTRWLAVRTLRNADSFIVHSSRDKENLAQLLGNLNPAVIRKTIHPQYELFPITGISKHEARGRLGVDGSLVLFFGLVRKYKGLMDLLEAMSMVTTPNLTCLVVGEFYDKRDKYEARARELGLTGRIRIIDSYIPNEDVELYFSAADVVVLPYRSATQSGIIQIAFRFARPVIATTVGGLPESIDNNRTGLLVPPQNPVALAHAIDRYFSESLESKFCAEIRRQGSRFSWDRVIETIESLN